MILDFFGLKKTCTHSKIPNDVDAAYCPDCGEYVENKWYLTRCSCCNIKRPAIVSFGKIKPRGNYCPNCGSKEFYVEEVEKINFINIDYCVCIKQAIIENTGTSRNQIWVDNNSPQLISAVFH